MNTPLKNVKLFSSGLLLAVCILAGAFFFVSRVVFAAGITYYVSPIGSDSNNGSNATPWLTLQKAETLAANGDTVFVAAGTYVENDPSRHTWNIAKGINWVAQGVVIVKGNAAANTAVYISGTNPMTFTGFTFDGESKTQAVYLASGSRTKKFIGCTFKNGTVQVFTGAGPATDITILGSTFTYLIGQGIESGGFTNLTVSGSTFVTSGATGYSAYEYRGTSAQETATFTNNTITIGPNYAVNITSPARNNYTFNNNTITTASVALRVSGRNSFTMTNNTINTAKQGLYLTASGAFIMTNNTFNLNSGTPSGLFYAGAATSTGTILIKNNTFNVNVPVSALPIISIDSGTFGTTIDGNTMTMQTNAATSVPTGLIYLADQVAPLIQNNTIETTGTGSVTDIYVTSSGRDARNPKILNNIFKSHAWNGTAITVGADYTSPGNEKVNGGLVQGNIIYGPYYYNPLLSSQVNTHAILYGHSYNGIVQYNTIYGEGYGVVIKGVGLPYTSGGVFYNTIINTKGQTAIRIKGVQNVKATNNTIYADASIGYPNFTAFSISINNAGQYGSGAMLRNNIMVGKGTAYGLVGFPDVTSQSGFSSDYNVLYRMTNGNVASSSTTNYTLAQWQAAGYDTHSITTDPLFTSIASNDYSLLYNSPAIDAGSGGSFTRDIIGNSVHGSADIGAFEYQPPYTMGTDPVDMTGNIGIYTSGKFRNTAAPSGTSVNFLITPAGGYVPSTYGTYATLAIANWNKTGNYYKKWTEAVAGVNSSVTHTVGDLAINTPYKIQRNGILLASVQSDGAGKISFTDTGSTNVQYEILAATSVNLTSSSNPAASGSTIVLTTSVLPATATGTVTFYDGITSLGTAILNHGTGSLSVTLSSGTHSLTAVYAGNATYPSSTSAEFLQSVSVAPTYTSVCVPTVVIPSQSVFLFATVTPSSATGSVQFFNNDVALASVPLGHGSGSLTTGALGNGTQTITALYNGSDTLQSLDVVTRVANCHRLQFNVQ